MKIYKSTVHFSAIQKTIKYEPINLALNVTSKVVSLMKDMIFYALDERVIIKKKI